MLRYVPDGMKTLEMCLNVVLNDGSALEFVPDNLKIKEICLGALVDHDEYLLEYIPHELKTDPTFLDELFWIYLNTCT